MRRRTVLLTQEQREELVHTRDHDPLPYMRTKCAAILKVADHNTIKQVGRTGLNRPFSQEAVRTWIDRYEQEGLEGLRVKAGRGRKPAFFPCPRTRDPAGRR